MKAISATFAVFGGIALFALAVTASALADPGRQHPGSQWHDQDPRKSQERRRNRKPQRIESGAAHYRYFGADPDRYFGTGPGSYDCYGYDCNW